MPTISNYSDVEFEWSDVITKSLSDNNVKWIAEAIFEAGLTGKLVAALNVEIMTDKDDDESQIELISLSKLADDVDKLVDDYTHGDDVRPNIIGIARRHFGRFIVDGRPLQ